MYLFNIKIINQMINKQKIYCLIDNKYNNYEIDISTRDLIYDYNLTENNLISLYHKYLNLMYYALMYNYKNYKYNIKKIKFTLETFPINFKLFNNSLLNINIYKYLNLNNNIYSLNLRGNLINDERLLTLCSCIKNMTNLKVLNLSGNYITDITPLNNILKNNIITKIDLSDNNINNFNLENLKINTSLKELLLNDNQPYYNSKIYIDKLYDGLKGNNSIEVLDLSNNNFMDFKILFETIKNNNSIKILKLKGNYIKTDYISEYLQNNKSCKKIYNQSSLSMNIESVMIRRYNLKNTDNFTDPNRSFYKSYLDDYSSIFHLEKIFKTLEYNNILNKFKFYFLNDIEYNSLCNMLKVNTSINYLYLIDVPIKLPNYTHDFHELFNILKYNSYIQELKINIIKMNIKEIKELSEMLKYNFSLKKLTIQLNNNPLNSLYSIYKSLEFNKNLEKFKIVIYNKNINYDLYPLCKMLIFNKSIKKIHINGFKFKNTDYILNLLKYNHHLTNIKLIDKSNVNIEYVNILNNNIKIQKLLTFNKNLYII